MSSTRLFDAASSSTTSRARPSRIASQDGQASHGSPSATLGQLTALATIRASDVLPVPARTRRRGRRGPMRPLRIALRSVATTASWPTTSPKRCERQRR